MEPLIAHLVDAGVLQAAQLTQAQARAQREGVSLWEALYALDSEFVYRALQPKRAFYYRRDAEQFETTRRTGQPPNLRTYFPPNLQRNSRQESVENFFLQLLGWRLAPVAWTEERVWIVSEPPVRVPTALKTRLLAGVRLHRLPAPPEQVADYRQLLNTFHATAMDIERPLIRVAHIILQQAINERISTILLEPREGSLVVRFLTNGDWQDVLTLPTDDRKWIDAVMLPSYVKGTLLLRYRWMAEMRIQVEPIDDFGRIPIRYRKRDYDLVVFTRVVNGQERMYLHFVRPKFASRWK